MTDSQNLKRTPLYSFHKENGARFVDFGGWEMPVQYTSILEEHKAVRTAAGLFDVSHMGEIEVKGPEAEKFLDQLLTNRIAGTPVTKAVYSPLCQPDGGVVDDLIVYRRADEDFLVCVNASNIAKDFTWMLERSEPFACQVTDASEAWSLLALQGPRAATILGKLENGGEATALKPFTFAPINWRKVPCLVCRTGYTGEDGFEIFAPAEKAGELARHLFEIGKPEGLLLAGLGARDSLRLEAGLPLYGHELSETITPLQAGLGWTVKLNKPNFIGKEALQKQKQEGIPQKVVFFRTGNRRILREGAEVFQGTQRVGHVLSGTLSPCLNEAIGSALVDSAAASSAGLEAELRGKRLKLAIARPPLYSSRQTSSQKKT